MTKTIMILGANTLQLPLIEKANNLGYDTLVVSPVPTEPGHRISTYSAYINVVDEQAVLDAAIRYDICGIITDQTDLPVRTVAYVAEKLGLPGNPYEVACLFTDKYRMREKCRELGIRTLQYCLCETSAQAEAFFQKLNKPVIVKPVDNQGSKGVAKAVTLAQLRQKFAEAMDYSRSKRILVEEFVTGREFLVEGICANYQFKNLCCGDTLYFDIPDVFSAYRREFPSTAPKALVDKVLDMNRRIVTGFGLKQGITHAEYIMDGDDVILLEIAARGGGVFISSDLIHLQTGLETEEFLLRIATEAVSELPEFSDRAGSCCYISFFLPQGTVTKVQGVEAVTQLPYTYHNNFSTLLPGMQVKPMTDKTSRFFVIVAADDHIQLMERLETIRSLLQVDVATADGTQGIIWQ